MVIMRWLNKHHRGFNRLMLVFTLVPVLVVLLYLLLSDDYRARTYYLLPGGSHFTIRQEKIIASWAQERWRKYDSDDSNKSPFSDAMFPGTLLQEVNSLPEARSFTDEHLQVIIERAITFAETYAARAAEARRRAVTHFLITVGVCAGFYVLAHLWFCILVWVIRGFRDAN